ncbi:MAG: hypothetical protein IPP15_20755 [Saprospiraceae bacterium]|uniref:Uncharacterized protein n=1 Tax=Candidatus Opimibacter skivensis TaxID=2982028 RepID=A0A9D7XPQ2_9BACT|nr:hypothetical protein [Candidatus Opimibacter skivensis]
MNSIGMMLAQIFTFCFYAYLICGLIFSMWFMIAGAKKLDHGIEETNWGTKWIFIPGSILLWVYLWIKILKQK